MSYVYPTHFLDILSHPCKNDRLASIRSNSRDCTVEAMTHRLLVHQGFSSSRGTPNRCRAKNSGILIFLLHGAEKHPELTLNFC